MTYTHAHIHLLILKTNLSSRRLFLALVSNHVFVQCHQNVIRPFKENPANSKQIFPNRVFKQLTQTQRGSYPSLIWDTEDHFF